jgi:hypothetical protein
VLLDTFSTGKFARLVREHAVKSTVLPPAMLSMLADDPAVTDLLDAARETAEAIASQPPWRSR